MPKKRKINWLASGIILGILVLAALVEYAMGRLPICQCGYVLPWYNYTNGPGNSQHLADWYSASHLIHGILFYGLLKLVARKLPVEWRLVVAVLLEVAWELFENSSFIINRYRAATIALDYFGDSIINSISDIIFCIFGFILAWRLPTRWSISLVLALELIVGYLVHDNLTLNIIMLISPVSAIKNWQAGPSPIPHSP